jgi:hypothetical protein
MLRTDLHDADLILKTLLCSTLFGAHLILTDFSVTTSGDLVWNEGHVLTLLSVRLALSSILESERFVLSIRVPVVMGLIMSVVLIERVIQVTVDPGELGDLPEIKRHLGIVVAVVVIPGSDGVQTLV